MCKIIFSDKEDKSTEVKEQSVLHDFYDGVFKQIWMCLHHCLPIVHLFFYSTVKPLSGAVVAEWLSSWLAEQEDRGSIPGLAT